MWHMDFHLATAPLKHPAHKALPSGTSSVSEPGDLCGHSGHLSREHYDRRARAARWTTRKVQAWSTTLVAPLPTASRISPTDHWHLPDRHVTKRPIVADHTMLHANRSSRLHQEVRISILHLGLVKHLFSTIYREAFLRAPVSVKGIQRVFTGQLRCHLRSGLRGSFGV